MPTIAQELQSIEEWLEGQGEMDDPNLSKRKRQLQKIVANMRTWRDGNANKQIVTVDELRNMVRARSKNGHINCVLVNLGQPNLYHLAHLTLEWTGQWEWPFVKVTLTNSQDRDDCFKYNAQRMEAP
jgi:hypothetical protein